MFEGREQLGRLEAIYVTSKRRSQQTAAPLARRLGLAPIVVDEPPDILANKILHEQRGRTLLVVGHSNTVPELVRLLTGVGAVPAINESDEYDTMYWVSVPAFGTASVVRIKF
jgi:broad specificity phosphatase PhoE